LPIFVGDGPPTDVDTGYGLACGVLLGLAAGRVAQLVLWPRTAMETFTERSAAQVDLCMRALGGGEGSSEGSPPGRDAAGLVGAYSKQLTQLGQLHAQAHLEPIEHALDDTRRAELLAHTQDLFDACLQAPRFSVDEEDPVRQDAEAMLAPLRAALLDQNQALLSSLSASARALRGGAPEPGTGLAEAQTTLEAQLAEIRDQPELARAAGARRTDALLAYVDSRRQLVARQLAIEAWLADWHQADSAGASA
jgi:hypothetical protein